MKDLLAVLGLNEPVDFLAQVDFLTPKVFCPTAGGTQAALARVDKRLKNRQIHFYNLYARKSFHSIRRLDVGA